MEEELKYGKAEIRDRHNKELLQELEYTNDNQLKRIKNMEELSKKIKETFGKFLIDLDKNTAGNKSAGRRARKASKDLEKLFKEYRKTSVEAQ